LRAHAAADPGLDPADAGHALAATRSAFGHRAVVLGRDGGTLLERLEAVERGAEAPGVIAGRAAGGGVAVLFSGQGGQRPGMGRELYAGYPIFAAALDEACAALAPHVDRPLRELMFADAGEPPDEPPLDRTEYTQPALFALEVALYRLAESWGLRPSHLMGHSVGEIAAAHAAGALSLPDAAALAAARGRLMQSVTAAGAMAAWQATEEEAAGILADLDGRVGVAAVNGPASLVVSGDRDAVREATLAWRGRGRRTSVLRTSHAFHSPHMDGVLGELRAVAAGLSFGAPRIPVVSNVTGRPVTAERLADPGYWAEHARRAVRFMDGVRWMRDDGAATFVELGPDAALVPMARESLATGGQEDGERPRPAVVAALRRGRPEAETFATAMAEAYVRGADLTWDHAFGEGPRRRVALPTYAFQRERHWFEPAANPPDVPGHPTAQERTPQDTEPGAHDEPDGTNAPDSAPGGAGAGSSFEERLSGLTGVERRRVLVETVREQVAAVLGHVGTAAVDPGLTFKELGFDSMAAAELSERLGAATGLALPAALTFDHPTPAAVAGHLRDRLAGGRPAPARRHDAPYAPGEPIAVVAMACRYPGGVASPEDLWNLVAGGGDAVGAFPSDRGWDLAALFAAAPGASGTSDTRAGGFVDDAGTFDAGFFGISPREALAMDPQQRLLLETSWEAFERAGITAAALRGSPAGVFVGATAQDYGPRLHEASDGLDGHLLTGTTPSVAAGRVAFTFGLEGPAVTVDTACSSSLVAMHLACQSLRRGESALALAGGATVLATPGMFTEFSRQGGLAPDGRCKPFAAAADGTGWAEGVGLVLLERLSDARRNGRRVLAVLRGSAINQDGASNGLTAPHGPSQERVIGRALADAGLSPSDVDAVEAHGTGTTLGDPIEAGALLAAYGQDRAGDRPLWLGSVKSNIGHTQAAAGVAGVIKMIMAMRHGTLPASLHIDEPTPHVDWSSGGIRLLTGPVGWPGGDRPRRAGVSSFGISGTNAHVIVEEPPAEPEAPPPAEPPVVPWVLTARGDEALRGQARALAHRLDSDPGPAPAEVGWSLVTTRSTFENRAVIVGDDLRAGLDALAVGEAHPALVTGRAVGTEAVLVFPGQGSQWAGMGAELLDRSPVFAERIAECEEALAPHVDWSLTEVLRGDGSELARVDVVQPVLWAVMVSLAAVWAEYGVVPSAVVGHSQGEIAAACVAGALSLQDAAKIVAVRSRVLRRLSGGGAMASLGVGEDEAAELLQAVEGVSVAAVNGPSSTVVSGPPEQVAAVVAAAQERDLRARLIDVDYASHGPQVDQIADELAEALAGIEPRSAEVAFYSTVTGARIETTQLDTAYWVTNLRRPVRFADAIDALLGDGYRVFVESSPHPVLTLGLGETFERADAEAVTVPTLRRDQGDPAQVAVALAQAFAAGIDVDWTRWFPANPRPATVDLPTYAFQGRRFWLNGTAGASGVGAAGLRGTGHPLLPAAVELADGEVVLTGRISAESAGWIAGHTVAGTTVVPGAVLLEWALRAADEAGAGGVRELAFIEPLVLPASGAVLVRVVVDRHDAEAKDRDRTVRIHSRPAGGDAPWTCRAQGTLGPPAEPLAEVEQGGAWPPPGAEPLDVAGFYERAEAAGYGYGPAFRGLRALWRRGPDLLAEVVLPESAGERAGYGVHPALLDAVLHPALLDDRDAPPAGHVRMPFAWADVSLWAGEATAVRVRLSPGEDGDLRVAVADVLGAPPTASSRRPACRRSASRPRPRPSASPSASPR
ncbi:type I polyketide synthase, partial [Actinomadura roseirufa]|uniref:type I polyketide synthase n=1 Tax=Actinomadura roseirufa TaxID=2094049 RepID=UPI001041AA04